ncbi:MAG TPA: amidohydrolase family protein [Longimicrobiales bacterium]
MIALVLALQTVAIQNVTVVPMDREAVLADHVVLVRNGTITAVGARGRVQIPKDARRIDGRGGYLVPGLADFHVHVRLRSDLGAYLPYGVTTLADMGGPDRVRAWRDSIRAGKAIGPDVFVGRFMDGAGRPGGVEGVEAARLAVARADSLGFDFIKVYNSLTAEQFDAIVGEAKQRGIAVLGHGVRAIGLERGFASGQAMVVHGEEYFYTELRRSVDTTNIPRVVAFTRQNDAYVIPNLSAYHAMTMQWGKPDVLEEYLKTPEAQKMPAYWVNDWRSRDYVKRTGSIDRQNEFLKKLTLAFQRAGIPLITGTDSPGIPGMVAGASIHEDLRLLVEAGLTPYEALTAATRTPGEFAVKHLHGTERFGIIAPGYRADFVLVSRNPLQDIGALKQPLAVMVRGNWLGQPQLKELLQTWSATTN